MYLHPKHSVSWSGVPLGVVLQWGSAPRSGEHGDEGGQLVRGERGDEGGQLEPDREVERGVPAGDVSAVMRRDDGWSCNKTRRQHRGTTLLPLLHLLLPSSHGLPNGAPSSRHCIPTSPSSSATTRHSTATALLSAAAAVDEAR
jgi:hypothetical protein